MRLEQRRLRFKDSVFASGLLVIVMNDKYAHAPHRAFRDHRCRDSEDVLRRMTKLNGEWTVTTELRVAILTHKALTDRQAE